MEERGVADNEVLVWRIEGGFTVEVRRVAEEGWGVEVQGVVDSDPPSP